MFRYLLAPSVSEKQNITWAGQVSLRVHSRLSITDDRTDYGRTVPVWYVKRHPLTSPAC